MGSSNSYCNSGGSTLVNGTIMQSSGNGSATRDEMKDENQLISGAGFKIILETDLFTFELSAKEKYLRKRKYNKISENTLVEIGEELYIHIENKNSYEKIESEGKWRSCGSRNGEKFIFEQEDSKGKLTGWYRIRKKIKRSDGTYAYKFNYYQKREGG